MIDLSSPTPLASALASLTFIGMLALLYGFIALLRRKGNRKETGGIFERIIAGLRWLDRTLVHAFSWLTGTRYRKRYIRLPVLLLYFLGLVAGSVFTPWPYGMGFISLGVFSVFVVFRHWSRDEDEAVSSVPFERKDIKIDGTLGAEVLLAVAFIFVFTPVAFAQLQAQGLGFTLDQNAGPFTFLIATLIETVKAGSLIDYYDLYADRVGFEKIGAPTEPTRWAKATIMGYRLSLNLLVLAALKRLLDVAKRRAEGADLRAVAEALRTNDADKQGKAISKLRDFALRGRGNARDMLEQIAEPRQSDHLPIEPETRFAAADALLDYGTQRGGASALYAAADGYRALMRDGFDRTTFPKKWRAAAHNLGNTLVQLGQQIGDPERLRDAADVYDELISEAVVEISEASRLNTLIVRANVSADLAMMTGQRRDLDDAVERYRYALERANAEDQKTQIAMLNTNLGATLADIAEIDSDEGVVRQAIAAYRAALEHLSADEDSETWSMAQNNLGNALADLGFWSFDAATLHEALDAHECALSARKKSEAPSLWAMSQTNLANALTRLANFDADPARLKIAIEHYEAAQSVYQREDFPRDWSWAEASLASAHTDLGHMSGETAQFEKAVQYCEGAIGGYASAQMPAKEAWAQGLKGNALVGLERYEDAAAAFNAALAWQTYETAGVDWVMSTNNLAACLDKLGREEEALNTLRQALQIAPDNQKLTSTFQTLSGAENSSIIPANDAKPQEPEEPGEHSHDTAPVQVKFLNWEMTDWNEGRFVTSFSANWRLLIDGVEHHWQVTEQEYLEGDGMGKGAGYEVVDLLADRRVLYRTFWDHWMNDNYNPEQDSGVDGEGWRIGHFAGTEIFWAIYHHVADQGISIFSRWDADEEGFVESIVELGQFSLRINAGDNIETLDVVKDTTPNTQSETLRHYYVSVQRICGEFVIGNVSPEFYAYWKDRDDFEIQVLNLGDPDAFDPGSPSPHPDGRECEGWYVIDDIAHMNNAAFEGNTIYVDEVRPDEDAISGYVPFPEGYSEQFDIDEVMHNMPKGFFEVAKEFDVDTEVGNPKAPVFVGKSVEKGAQTDVYVSTEGDFNLSKMSFEIWNMDGDLIIASIRYDGVELEISPDSSMGRAFYAYMGELS